MTIENWNKIKGHKWIITPPHSVIPTGMRLVKKLISDPKLFLMKKTVIIDSEYKYINIKTLRPQFMLNPIKFFYHNTFDSRAVDYKEAFPSSIFLQFPSPRKFWFYTVAALSLGLIPLFQFGLSQLIRRLVIPSSGFNLNKLLVKKKEFIKSHTNISHSFLLETYDHAKIDGMALFQNPDAKNRFMEKEGAEQKWIVYFNGNAESYEDTLETIENLKREANANILIFNYRCTGNSSGLCMSAEDLVRDGEVCLKYLLSKGIQEKDIFLFGRSLGGAVASRVATLHTKVGLISFGSFSRLSDVIRDKVGALAAKLIVSLSWDLDSVKTWKQLQCSHKLMVLHKADSVITYRASSLYKALKQHLGKAAAKIQLHKIKQSNKISYVKHSTDVLDCINGLYVYQNEQELRDQIKLKLIQSLIYELGDYRLSAYRAGIIYFPIPENIVNDSDFEDDQYKALDIQKMSQSEAFQFLKNLIDKDLQQLQSLDKNRISAPLKTYHGLLTKMIKMQSHLNKVLTWDDLHHYIIKELEPHNHPLYSKDVLLNPENRPVIEFIKDFFNQNQ